MSWLNLNQSLSSLKGQITNFASEVLSEVPAENTVVGASQKGSTATDLEEKCRNQELEIASLKKLTEELQASLQSERLSRKNGIKEEESSWYWDPPAQNTKTFEDDIDSQYKIQIRRLQDELSSLREREPVDHKVETEEELKRLREENKNLTTNLDDLDNQHQLAMERLISLKKELQKNFEVLKQEHEDLKNSNDEYSLEIKHLLQKIGERDKEIEEMKTAKSDYETLYHKYQNLERIHGLLRENAEKFQEENQDLHEEVFKLQEQVTKMEHEIEVAAKHSELSDMVPKETYDDLVKELNELKDRRNSNHVQIDEINIDDNAKSVIENLKREVTELKYKLAQKESDNGDSKAIRPERIMHLYNKYVNFELPIDYVGEIPSASDNIVFYKLESVFKTINSFKKDIDLLDHKLSEKDLNTNHLQTQIDDLTTENDFLTTDIQHLERELNDMRKNNDFLISEIAALKNTSKLEPIIETHEDNLAKLETELADCNKMNKSFETEIKRIESELSEVMYEKTMLQENLRDLKEKYTTMLREMDSYKNQTKAVEELEHSVAAKQAERLKKTADEVHDLKKKLNSANAKNEQLSIDIHILENDKVLLTKQVDDLKNAYEEKSSAHRELENLKHALDNKLQNFENKLDEVIKDKKEIENDKEKLQEQVTVLEQELSATASMSDMQKITTSEQTRFAEKINQLMQENERLSKMIDTQEKETEALKLKENQLLAEINALKNDTMLETENRALHETIDELKAKIIQQEIISHEVANLREENKKLVEKKLQLETELSSTDSKIVNLEQEFEKLISDLNEKDSLIDALNVTVSENNERLAILNQNVLDLENSVSTKNDEILKLTQTLGEITQKFNDINYKSNASQEELQKLLNEKEDMAKQIFSLNDEINAKNSQVSTLTASLAELETLSKEYNFTIDNKDKEIKELNQSIVELSDKIKVSENLTHHNDDYAKLVHEKQVAEAELNQLKENLTLKEKVYQELKATHDHIEKMALEYKTVLNNATTEKAELINLINLKHNESIQYHNEIQRLNQVILEQTNEFKKIVEEKDRLIQNSSQNCSNCERLTITLKEKDEIIIALNESTREYDRLKGEVVNASEMVRQLTDKCDNLEKSLAVQLEVVKKLTAENAQLSEQEQNSTRELERLRRHLVETEENYTQELMTSEQKLTECTARLHQVEERAKQTSTVYTSNSIRANQEVETLRNQIKLLEKQREDVQVRLSEAEDARSRSEAALTNLQVVLEQFQLDKERDIQTATEKIRNKMERLKGANESLHEEIARLNHELQQSAAGLQAAARLGDQLETKAALISDLKDQVRTLQTSVSAAEERYHSAVNNQQDKVDKNLVKNLLINYVHSGANNTDKTQVLRVLSTVLDFNQQECQRLGLARAGGGGGGGLAAQFVSFLQDESRPRAALPSMMDITGRGAAPPRRESATPPAAAAGHGRTASAGSGNLLLRSADAESASHSSHASRASLDTGVNQTRDTEGAILKYVLKDM